MESGFFPSGALHGFRKSRIKCHSYPSEGNHKRNEHAFWHHSHVKMRQVDMKSSVAIPDEGKKNYRGRIFFLSMRALSTLLKEPKARVVTVAGSQTGSIFRPTLVASNRHLGRIPPVYTVGSICPLLSVIYVYMHTYGLPETNWCLEGTTFLLKKFRLRTILVFFHVCVLLIVVIIYLSWTLIFSHVCLIVVKTLRYEDNNPLREMLYIVTTTDAKFKSKSWFDVFEC